MFHASITPKLAGDSCVDLNSFYLKPMTMDDLFHSNYSRNFWVKSHNYLWSATGNSLLQKQNKDDHLIIQGGFLWHKMIRKNEKIGLKSEILNFIPSINQSIELMQINITNIKDEPQIIQVSSAIPIYGRSADNIRDHNHVTSLLNQIEITDYGVVLKPTLSFDERGHTINYNMYQFYMLNENLDTPDEIYPVMDYFVGDGSLDWPDYLTKTSSHKINLANSQGLNIIGAVTYFDIKLKPNESVSYFILMGISETKLNPLSFLSFNKFNELLKDTKNYWKDQISSLSIKTSQNKFDNWLNWVSIQPILR
ncbi:MAG: cellobiose phosphorylase, partial [Candidatus Heimdallarchaeota archaeon]